MANVVVERQRLRTVIQGSGVAILMTFDEHGTTAGRPMLPLFIANDPDIYFLTHDASRKVAQIAARPRVALTVVASGTYLFITGQADLSRSTQLIEALWHPSYRAWFPNGAPSSIGTRRPPCSRLRNGCFPGGVIWAREAFAC